MGMSIHKPNLNKLRLNLAGSQLCWMVHPPSTWLAIGASYTRWIVWICFPRLIEKSQQNCVLRLMPGLLISTYIGGSKVHEQTYLRLYTSGRTLSIGTAITQSIYHAAAWACCYDGRLADRRPGSSVLLGSVYKARSGLYMRHNMVHRPYCDLRSRSLVSATSPDCFQAAIQ